MPTLRPPMALLRCPHKARFRLRPFSLSATARNNERQSSSSPGREARQPQRAAVPRVVPTTGFEKLDVSNDVEEENLVVYRPEDFYPVRLGEVFQDQYQVVAKLGFGSSSTTWLGRDLQSKDLRYVSPKVIANTVEQCQELSVYEHMLQHEISLGPLHIRPLVDCFTVEGPHGRSHHVLVQVPLAISMDGFQYTIPGKVFTPLIVREALKQVVPALGFLHGDVGVIHTDVHPGNLLIGLQDPEECFAQLEQDELEAPGPRKVLEDRTIYRSRVIIGNIGPLYLCDFGHARIGSEGAGKVMAMQYRAPEIILGMRWSYPIDMWGVGLSAWNMLHAEKLFDVYDTDDEELNDAQHLANMIALMGPPPAELLRRSENALEFWDENGHWRGIVPIPESRTLENLEGSLEGGGRERFLDFMRRLLRWVPEERLTAKEAVGHPWVTKAGDDDDT